MPYTYPVLSIIKYSFVLVIFCLSVSTVAVAEVTRFWTLNNDHALKNTFATDIAIGPKGFIWMAAHSGLIRFDGNEKKTYRYHPEKKGGLLSNHLNALAWDKQGYLWIGSNLGVNRFDPKNELFTTYYLDGVNKTSLESNQNIYDLFVDSAGMVWVSTKKGGLNQINPTTGKITSFIFDGKHHGLDKYIKQITQDNEGRMWLGTKNSGLITLSKVNGQITHLTHDANDINSLSSDNILSLFKDSKGRVWAGTTNTGVIYISQTPRHLNTFYCQQLTISNPISQI